jgi:hypothetical protein
VRETAVSVAYESLAMFSRLANFTRSIPALFAGGFATGWLIVLMMKH